MRVLVGGYYGFGNAGDEAILSVLVAGIRDARPDAQVIVASGSPDDTAVDHGVDAVHWQDLETLVRTAEEADRIIVGGGGLFQDHWGFHPEHILTPQHANIDYYAGFALIARLTATPLLVYGVGVGPIASPEAAEYTRITFATASSATVRTAADRQEALAVGADPGKVTVTADPGWLLHVPEPGERSGERRIAVAPRNWDGDWQAPLAATLDSLSKELDAEVVFVPLQRSPHPLENDAAAAMAISDRMEKVDRTAIMWDEASPADIAATLAAADLVIATRLHGVILAAATATPVIGLCYDPKVRRLLDEIGVPGFDLSALDGPGLASAATDLFDEVPQERARLEQVAAAMRDKAAGNQEALAGFLADPPPPAPPGDQGTSAALTRLIFDRIADNAQVAQAEERARAAADHARDLDGLLRATEKRERDLADRYRELWDSKAVRASRRWWGVRSRLTGKSQVEAEDEGAVAAEAAAYRRRVTTEIEGFVAATPEALGTVLYPPTIGWSAPLFQRPQQMALAFAHLGYRVLYMLHDDNAEFVRGVRQIGDRLALLSVPDQHLDLLGAVERPLVMGYVYNFDLADRTTDPVAVYEHIDHLDVFKSSYPIEQLTAWHQHALAEAAVVAASAADLRDELLSDRPDTLLVPNGVDYEHFARRRDGEQAPDGMQDPLGQGGPVIGYYGALAEWIDYDLIEQAARALPDHAFVFIGPDYDGTMERSAAFALPNVWWLGPRPYQDLPSYLRRFDVATIPFVVDEVSHRVSPLKLFEYMAGGKPVVTTDLRECRRYQAVLAATDADDYIACLRRAIELGGDLEYRRLLRRTARDNTWDRRAAAIAEAAIHLR